MHTTRISLIEIYFVLFQKRFIGEELECLEWLRNVLVKRLWYELVRSLIVDFADKSWLFFESTKTIILPGVFGAFHWYLKFPWNVILQSNGYMLGYMWTFTPFMSSSVSFFKLRLNFKYSSTLITKKNFNLLRNSSTKHKKRTVASR